MPRELTVPVTEVAEVAGFTPPPPPPCRRQAATTLPKQVIGTPITAELAVMRLQVPHAAREGDRGKGLAGRQDERARQREDRLARQRSNRPRVSENVQLFTLVSTAADGAVC